MSRLAAVLFDRDGTLVEDVPYNSDPDKVTPIHGAVETVAALRRRGLKVGVVTNQSGVARKIIPPGELQEVQDRIDQIFGAFDTWCVCPHAPSDGCDCRKPLPGLVMAGAAALGVTPQQVVVVGDRLSDLAAARAAGAIAVLVPSDRTEPAAAAGADHRLRAITDLVALVEGWVRTEP
jgi:D-glycero-D-manno-heptose 1,7-bisphosphate phosphatase